MVCVRVDGIVVCISSFGGVCNGISWLCLVFVVVVS